MCIDYVLANGDLDDYCNLVILIFAKIVNVFSNPQISKASTFKATAAALWDEIQKWYRLRPPEVCPLLKENTHARAFPVTVFTRSAPSTASP